MIGFKIYAYGGGGFTYDSRRWTEGSLAALKLAMSRSPNKPLRKSKGLINGVEKGFHNIALKNLYNICAYSWDLKMSIIGDLHFSYYFRQNASADRTYFELLQKISNQKQKLGDQVIIEICTAVYLYHLFVISENYGGPLHMLITIDL